MKGVVLEKTGTAAIGEVVPLRILVSRYSLMKSEE